MKNNRRYGTEISEEFAQEAHDLAKTLADIISGAAKHDRFTIRQRKTLIAIIVHELAKRMEVDL